MAKSRWVAGGVRRWAGFRVLSVGVAAAAALLTTTVALPTASSASTPPTQMTYACALHSNGLMSYVSSPSGCKSNSAAVKIAPGPTKVCEYTDGSVFLVPPGKCLAPNVALTLPSLSGPVYFCAANGSGVLNTTTNPAKCPSGTFAVEVVAPQPVLANIETTTLQYYAGTPPVPITSTLTVSSAETTTLAGATVTISSGLKASEDSLGFTNQNSISGIYSTSTGVLTLTGTASVADYQAALRSVTYKDSNALTATAGRTISFQVNDGLSYGNLSNVAARAVNVMTNAAPTAGNVSASTDKHTAININVLSSASDVDGDTLSVASVNTTGTKGLVSINTNGTIHYDPNGQFESLQQGQTATDTFTYEVSDGFQDSAAGTVKVTIDGVNDPPVLSNIETTPETYDAGTPGVPVTSTLTVSSPQTTTLAGATVSIASGLVASEDSLGFTTQNGITGSYSAGTLTLTGTASVADYQAALRSVTYSDSNGASATTGPRTIAFQVNDGLSSGNLSNVDSRTITVNPNSPPTASSVNATTDKHTAININVLSSAADPDGDNLSVVSVSTVGTKGSVSINPDGTVHYDPNGQFQGLTAGQQASDSFGYTVSDGFFTATGTVTVKITGVNDLPVISNVETPPLAYQAQQPAVAITNALTIADDDDATIGGATVSISSGFDSGADTLGFVTQNGITGIYDASHGVLTLSGPASIADYQAALQSVTFFTSDNSASPASRVISFTVTDSVGATSETASRAITVAAAPMPPTVVNQSYNAVGNTSLGVGLLPNGPAIFDGGSVLSGDSDPDPTATLTVTGNTTPAHGALTMNPDGTFTYLPNAGFSGTDSFTVTVAGSNDLTATSTETVTITVGAVVWYVDDSKSAAGTGQSTSPFNTLAAANAAAGPNSIIFLYQGSATYTGGVTLQSGEELLGQPYGLTVEGNALVAPEGSNPTITNSSGDGVALAEGSDVEAVNISGASGNGVIASGVNDATVGGTSTVAISGSGGNGIDISGGSGGLNFANVTVTGSAGHSVTVASRTGGTAEFGGSITDNGTGISLSGNSGATISFSGKLTISTGATAGFSATGGGTVTATGAGSTIATTTGTAVDVANTTIGSGGLVFQSVSSNGASPGIGLSNTGTTGGFTVTGTGPIGSGGTVTESTADGISLSSTSSPSFTDMVIENNAAGGINGSQVNGLSLAGSTVSGNGDGTIVSGQNDDGLDFSPNGTGSPNGLTGTVSITNSTITGSADNNAIISDSSGTLGLTVTGSTFSNNSTTTGNDGLHIDANGSTDATVSVTGSTFTDNRGDHFQFSTDSAATGTNSVTFSENTLSSPGMAGESVLGGGVVISPAGSSQTVITLDNNNIQVNPATSYNGIAVDATSGTATVSGYISGNSVGSQTVPNSGSGFGIGIYGEGSTTETLEITNNALYQYQNAAGIYFNDGQGNATMNLTITGNAIAHPGTFGDWGLLGEGGALSTDSGKVCAVISGNSMTGSGQSSDGGADIELDQAGSTTYELPGYTGGSTDTNAVANYVAGNNVSGGTPYVIATVAAGGFTGGASCPTP